MGDRTLTQTLEEIERDARRGERDFFRCWHKRVCDRQDRCHLIDQATFDRAKAVFEAARRESAESRPPG